LGRVAEAQPAFKKAVSLNPPSPTRELALLDLGLTSVRLGEADEAVPALESLAQLDPGNREGLYLLGMAYIMQHDPGRAVQVLDRLLLEGSNGRAFYARALANYSLKRKAQALSDIANAIRLGPVDQNLLDWRTKIAAMPEAR
jgi:tetratricopeptide (TPR) repeat protein